MGYDRTRVFLIRLHGFEKTPGLGEDEKPVKLQQQYLYIFFKRTRGFPIQTQRKQHDWTIELTELALCRLA